ncbi:hypothetical protein ScPMuIL_004390, partial [Solemya velum]
HNTMFMFPGRIGRTNDVTLVFDVGRPGFQIEWRECDSYFSVSTVGCNMFFVETTTTTTLTSTASLLSQDARFVFTSNLETHLAIYNLAHMWYAGTAVVIVVVVGLVVSILTGITIPKTLDPRLICPFFDVFFPYLPENIRQKLRFGVPHESKEIPGCESSVTMKSDFETTDIDTMTYHSAVEDGKFFLENNDVTTRS